MTDTVYISGNKRIKREPSDNAVAVTSESRGRSHLSNKTPDDRVLEYGWELFRSCDGQLVCQFCDKAVDPRRRSSIEYHLKSFTHLRKVMTKMSENAEDAEEPLAAANTNCSHTDSVVVVTAASSALVYTAAAIAGNQSRNQTITSYKQPAGVKSENTDYSIDSKVLLPLKSESVESTDTHNTWPQACISAVSTCNAEKSIRIVSPYSLGVSDGCISSLCETELHSEDSVQIGGDSRSLSTHETSEELGRPLAHCCCCCYRNHQSTEGRIFSNEVVLKVRIREHSMRPFVLFELPSNDMTINRLTAITSVTLGVPSKDIKEIIKLPNTLLRRDKDVRRLLDYQELELLLQNT